MNRGVFHRDLEIKYLPRGWMRRFASVYTAKTYTADPKYSAFTPTLVNERRAAERAVRETRGDGEEEGARCKRVNLLTVGVYGDRGNRKPRDYSQPK